MANNVTVEISENDFTKEIRKIFTQKAMAINVHDATITVKHGTPDGYGRVEIKGHDRVNVNALNRQLSEHYIANVTFMGPKKAELQICPGKPA